MIKQPTSITPLITFRILFGAIMLVSIIRFALRGWIYELYVEPTYFFTYYGFEWVRPPGEWGMYALFFIMGVAAFSIMVGFMYRAAAVVFFLVFTYVELIDKANYLNHYYFVSVISFLLILVPANRSFSIDVHLKPSIRMDVVPAWTINILKFQLGAVYFFAGLAKLTPDWLFQAMPLKLWLPAHAHLPIIGSILQWPETAFVFSWGGAIYDLTIVFFLLWSRTRGLAYCAVIVFHLMTGVLFQIGMFPYIMILATLIFFSPEWHARFLEGIQRVWRNVFRITWVPHHVRGGVVGISVGDEVGGVRSGVLQRGIGILITLHICLQVLLPFRHHAYPGSLFWSEQGYRFSWRVMLMEKAGYTVFKVRDSDSNKAWEVANWQYLTPNQEKMMATQPDMILQFAHHLRDEYTSQGLENIFISVDSYVTLNGRRSQLFIDPTVDLTRESRGWTHKKWILPFKE